MAESSSWTPADEPARPATEERIPSACGGTSPPSARPGLRLIVLNPCRRMEGGVIMRQNDGIPPRLLRTGAHTKIATLPSKRSIHYLRSENPRPCVRISTLGQRKQRHRGLIGVDDDQYGMWPYQRPNESP